MVAKGMLQLRQGSLSDGEKVTRKNAAGRGEQSDTGLGSGRHKMNKNSTANRMLKQSVPKNIWR